MARSRLRSQPTRSRAGSASGSTDRRSSSPTARRRFRRAAVLTGGAARYVGQAVAEGYDCFVTGEGGDDEARGEGSG